MKQTFLNVIILLLSISMSSSLSSQTNNKHVPVSGYTTSDGTIVQPYMRTAPNSTNRDNFSTLGNTNTYTGKDGTITPDNKPLPTSQSYNNDLPVTVFRPDPNANILWEIHEQWRKEDKMNNLIKETNALIESQKEYRQLKAVNDLNNAIIFYDRYSKSDKLFIEVCLSELGYYVGIVDGYIDNFTIDAVKKFQSNNGLTSDGKAGDITVARIISKLKK